MEELKVIIQTLEKNIVEDIRQKDQYKELGEWKLHSYYQGKVSSAQDTLTLLKTLV